MIINTNLGVKRGLTTIYASYGIGVRSHYDTETDLHNEYLRSYGLIRDILSEQAILFQLRLKQYLIMGKAIT